MREVCWLSLARSHACAASGPLLTPEVALECVSSSAPSFAAPVNIAAGGPAVTIGGYFSGARAPIASAPA